MTTSTNRSQPPPLCFLLCCLLKDKRNDSHVGSLFVLRIFSGTLSSAIFKCNQTTLIQPPLLTCSLVPSKSSNRFYSHDSSVQKLCCLFPTMSCLIMCPQFCSSEQFLLSCLAQTSGLLVTTDIITLWISTFFCVVQGSGQKSYNKLYYPSDRHACESQENFQMSQYRKIQS